MYMKYICSSSAYPDPRVLTCPYGESMERVRRLGMTNPKAGHSAFTEYGDTGSTGWAIPRISRSNPAKER